MKKDKIIRWVIGIIIVIYMIFQLYVSFSFSLSISEISKNMDDITAPYMIYEDQENWAKESLEEKGYEIVYINIGNFSTDAPFFKWYNISDDTVCEDTEEICWSDKVGVYISAKSLGNRNEQVWDFLTTSYTAYENAFVYRMEIKSPTDSCEYLIVGNTLRDYFNNYSLELREKVQYQIDNLAICS